MKKLLIPDDNKLSLNAKGILGSMLNDPYCDYRNISSLCEEFRTDPKSEIEAAITELCKSEYIIKLSDEVYAVNKRRIIEMKAV